MLRAKARGRLLQGEADYQLQIIYLWYEQQTARALNILESLRQHYPGNPLFLSETARIQDEYLHDTTASLDSWRAVLASAREQRSNAPVLAETQSRLAIARHLDFLHQTDHAIEQLEAVIALRPQEPYASLPLAYLRLGEAHDRLGNRPAALGARIDRRPRSRRIPTSTRSASPRTSACDARSTPSAPRRIACRSRDGGGSRRTRSRRGDRTRAIAGVARERSGSALPVRTRAPGEEERSRRTAQFESAIRGAKNCPPPILGMAYVEAARLLERAGRRDQAISYYRIAAALFGASADTQSSATRALTRLRAESRARRASDSSSRDRRNQFRRIAHSFRRLTHAYRNLFAQPTKLVWLF